MHKLVLAAIATGLVATPALAEQSRDCSNAPKSQWMSQDAAKQKLTDQGYDVRRLKLEGSCYELYAMKDGERLEALMDPATGKIVGDEQGEQ